MNMRCLRFRAMSSVAVALSLRYSALLCTLLPNQHINHLNPRYHPGLWWDEGMVRYCVMVMMMVRIVVAVVTVVVMVVL